MNKVTTIEAAMEHVHDGQVIMFGGFMTVGTPVKLIDAILEKGVKDITVCMQLTDYYRDRGWNGRTGVPEKKTIERLGLAELTGAFQ